MTQIRQFTQTYPTITKILTDDASGSYLWIAYDKDTDDICHLQKVSAFDLDQIYYDVEIEAKEIVDLKIYSSYIYVLYNNSTYLASRYSTTNPYTTTTVNFARPVGLAEEPVECTVMGSYIYFLLPGIISGENAKILRYGITGTYNTTIDLSGVTNANSMTNDGTYIWVISNEDPGKLVRVWYDTTWLFETTNLA
jgi:hypothetical protein